MAPQGDDNPDDSGEHPDGGRWVKPIPLLPTPGPASRSEPLPRVTAAARWPVEPTTIGEWQVAVDAADACLTLNSARRYGLIAGGPEVNVARCSEILDRGVEMGVFPIPDAIERFTRALTSLRGGR